MNLIAEPSESTEIFVKEEPISEENLENAALNFYNVVKKETCLLGDEEGNLYGTVKPGGFVSENEAGHFYNTVKKVECLSEYGRENFNGSVEKETSIPEDEAGNKENPNSFTRFQTEEEERKEVLAEDVFTLWKMKEEEGDGSEKFADVPQIMWKVEDIKEDRASERKVTEALPFSYGAQNNHQTRKESPFLHQHRALAKNQQTRLWNNNSNPARLQVKRLEAMQRKGSSELEFCYVCVKDIAEGCSFKEHFDQAHQGSCLCFVCGISNSSFTSFLNHLNSHSLSCENCNVSFTSQKSFLLHHKFYHNSNNKSLIPIQPKPTNYASWNEQISVSTVKYSRTEYETPNQLLSIVPWGSGEGDPGNPETQLKQQVLEIKDEIVVALSNFKPLSHTPKLNHICDLCQKGFRTRQHLRRHEFTHREKPQICKQCCLSFDTLEELKEHRINIHAGNLPYVCKICGLAYEKSVSFRDHMKKIHFGGKKSYQCELCNKVLSNRLIYQTHLRTHSGEKPFKCAICGKSYHDKYSMLKHERLHTAQATYKCPLCEKSYNRSCLMSEHIKWNHAITSEVEMSNYRCGVCQEELGNADCFLRHVYNHSCEEVSCNALKTDVEVLIE